MSDAAQTIPSRVPAKQIQRMAWAIVWLAFAMFCGVCVGTSIAVYAFLFYSVAPLKVEAHVGKGTVVISSSDLGERGQRVWESLNVLPARLSTDTLSQATLVINTSDANNETQFVAAVTLKNNSEVLLRRASRPRFDWSDGQYEIELSDLRGDMDIVFAGIGSRPIKLQITTWRGEKITLTKPGRYAISATDFRVQVSNRLGEAVLSSADQNYNPLLLQAGQDGLLLPGRPPVTAFQRTNLIDNGLFIFDALNATYDGSIRMPTHWGCSNAKKDLPSGQYLVSDWKGRTALQLLRGNNATTNGETRCQQPYAPAQDVSGYNFLELETTFLITSQSISECGVEGSECPLMIHLVYTDTNGIQREWYQGFYATLDPLYDFYKPRCASCTQDHQQINKEVWYTFESGNLLNVLPADQRPASISKIEFYASGHEYNVYVGEISLFAGIQEAVLPDAAPVGSNP